VIVGETSDSTPCVPKCTTSAVSELASYCIVAIRLHQHCNCHHYMWSTNQTIPRDWKRYNSILLCNRNLFAYQTQRLRLSTNGKRWINRTTGAITCLMPDLQSKTKTESVHNANSQLDDAVHSLDMSLRLKITRVK
jgi:hypothetical protein